MGVKRWTPTDEQTRLARHVIAETATEFGLPFEALTNETPKPPKLAQVLARLAAYRIRSAYPFWTKPALCFLMGRHEKTWQGARLERAAQWYENQKETA